MTIFKRNPDPRIKPPVGSVLDPDHLLARGLTACWLMNEQGGGRVYDLAGNWTADFHANVGNYPTWTPDGVLFDSNGESIVGPERDAVLTNIGTILFGYKKTNTPASYYYWFALEDDYQNFSLLSYTGGSAYLYIGATYINFTCPWIDSNTHNVVVTWDSITDERQVFNDGLINYEETKSFSWPDSSKRLTIGGRLTGTDRHAGGIIYYFYTFDRVLTADEIAWLHAEPYCMILQPQYWYMVDFGAAGGGTTILFSASPSIASQTPLATALPVLRNLTANPFVTTQTPDNVIFGAIISFLASSTIASQTPITALDILRSLTASPAIQSTLSDTVELTVTAGGVVFSANPAIASQLPDALLDVARYLLANVDIQSLTSDTLVFKAIAAMIALAGQETIATRLDGSQAEESQIFAQGVNITKVKPATTFKIIK